MGVFNRRGRLVLQTIVGHMDLGGYEKIQDKLAYQTDRLTEYVQTKSEKNRSHSPIHLESTPLLGRYSLPMADYLPHHSTIRQIVRHKNYILRTGRLL